MIDREFNLQDHDLYLRTFEMAAQIPPGKVSTYGAIARALGDVAASRSVGLIMAADRSRPFPVPCHRVVYSDGRVGWYQGMGMGTERKAGMLRSEGVQVQDGRVQDLDAVLFRDFKGEPLLSIMAAQQIEMASMVCKEGDARSFERVAGLDIAYRGDEAFAAMVVLDRRGRVLEERTVRRQVNFPYVPGYLGYREMAPYSALLDGRTDGTLFLVDGHGTAHPRRAGIACQFGVVNGLASAGMAKTILAGAMKGDSLIIDGEEAGRLAIASSGRTYFASVGHRASLDSVCGLISELPEDPMLLAHRLAAKAKGEA